eukprot:6002675-Alexandrium_andersonii.AAC.1
MRVVTDAAAANMALVYVSSESVRTFDSDMPPWALSDEALVDTSQGCVPVAVNSRPLVEGEEL